MLGSHMVTMKSLSLILSCKTAKFLRTKIGGVEDEMLDEEEEDEDKKAVWGRSKRRYYNANEATSSDEEIPAEEEAEVLRLQREKEKSSSMEDFGLDDISPDEATVEPTLGEITVGGKGKFESGVREGTGDDIVTAFEEFCSRIGEAAV
ncbi:uncharacterized protein LOC108957177 isoform X2 [Eucalyptus grandis]|uniref:uncharacterized protein LOC108957177 isoform X2 n=1 Tax=Eucalyptus grandis TaxID=71139 RepID=UPI00192E8734|nr:uncharacterized protein LOC108957177 isoform X2 [Eucalyptus grandis]XP_039156732.1 uncharacterized protein LOC108957177 isoform X2 [Eucalyptus grandis]